MTLTGRIVRFDHERGYGFISPDSGGEDVFIHANALGERKYQMATGVPVRFEVMGGGKGLKAYNVDILSSEEAERSLAENEGAARADSMVDDESFCDVLSSNEYLRELTETMLVVDPPLTTAQVLDLRNKLLASAKHHRWVEG